MKKLQLILALLFIFCFQNFAVADQIIKIRVTQFPPNYYKDANGQWTGLGVDLASAIVGTAGFKPEFKNLPWARGLASMQNGRIHYITNIKKTEERSAFINWIGPVRKGETRLIVKKGNENLPIKILDDFITISRNKNKKFGIQRDYALTEEFSKRLENDPEFKKCFEYTTKGELNFYKVTAGRILGFFESIVSANYRIKNDPDYKELAIHSYILRKTPTYHGVSKKGVDKETLQKLRDAFERLKKNGKLQQIVNKYIE